MEFSVYLCIFIIFNHYGSQTTASQSHGISEQFFKLLSEYIRNSGGYKVGGVGTFQTGDARGLPLPLLILPVPAGSVNTQDQNVEIQNEDHLGIQSRLGFQEGNSQQNTPKGFSIHKQLNKQFSVQQGVANNEHSSNNFGAISGVPHRTIIVKEPSVTTKSRLSDVQQETAYDEHSSNSYGTNSGAPHRTIIVKEHSKTTKPRLPDVQQDELSSYKFGTNSGVPHRAIIGKEPSITTKSRLSDVQPDDEFSSNNFGTNSEVPHRTFIVKESSKATNPRLPETSIPASSKDLLRQFHAQYAHLHGENLPPAVIDKAALEVTYESRFGNIQEVFEEQDQVVLNQRQGGIFNLPTIQEQNTPPTPQWNFPLKMKAELLVPRAEYTEPYQLWFNSKTGASKIDFHEGGTITYRTSTPDGRQRKVSKRTNRLGESNIAECIVASPQDVDFRAPGLPDLTNYQFGGYENSEQGSFEKWVYQLRGNPGQYGASAQESLTFHHEMLVKRGATNAIPVAYSVKIDSSVLGVNCDGYSHRYFDVEDLHEDDDSQFDFDIDANCQQQEAGDITNPVHRIHLEPLHEFSLPGRDDRYDVEIETFKTQYERTYMDSTEEAMRKNLFIQHSRFIMSGNRESATFELEMNFLGDRLEVELSLLRGVSWQDDDDIQGRGLDEIEDFPHPEPVVRNLSKSLPKEFDWRPLGAVSDVKWQGSCPSCWAFSVAGAVEGALFVRTRRLIPLSEQCLVDCARPFGTNGCGGTWPRFAYNYVKARGLPAREEYGPYVEKEETCHTKPASEPVTHISAYVNVTQKSVPALQIAIRRHSPSVVIIDAHANSFIYYKKGVLYDDRCGKTKQQSNHAVLAVGWGEHRRTPYFILKNSWSAAWGEQGYVRVQGPANTCGVLTQPSYPRLEDTDVDRLPN